MKTLALIFALCSSLAVAGPIFQCVDAKTKKIVFQDMPCEKNGLQHRKEVKITDNAVEAVPLPGETIRRHFVNGKQVALERFNTPGQPQQYQQQPQQYQQPQQNTGTIAPSGNTGMCEQLKYEMEYYRQQNTESGRKQYGDALYRYNTKCR